MPIEAGTKQPSTKKIGVSVDGERVSNDSFGPGAVVSLNLERRPFLGLPDGSLHLTVEKPSARIPLDIGEGHLSMLKSALDRGDLVMGGAPVPPKRDESALDDLKVLVDDAESPQSIRQEIFSIASRGRHVQGLTPDQTLRALAEYELGHKCRDSMVNFLATVMDHTIGPSAVVEHPQDKRVFELPTDEKGKPIATTIRDGAPRSEEDRKKIKDLI